MFFLLCFALHVASFDELDYLVGDCLERSKNNEEIIYEKNTKFCKVGRVKNKQNNILVLSHQLCTHVKFSVQKTYS